MSGYRYTATPKERRAAAMLRELGWSVDEPQCPECHGNGFVYEVKTAGDRIFGSGTASTHSCSQGCERPTAFYFSSLSSRRSVTADGTVGMRRGVSE